MYINYMSLYLKLKYLLLDFQLLCPSYS